MERKDAKSGVHVRVVLIEETMGMHIDRKFLAPKQVGLTGTLVTPVPESCDEIWFVQHDGCKDVGAYTLDEIELA